MPLLVLLLLQLQQATCGEWQVRCTICSTAWACRAQFAIAIHILNVCHLRCIMLTQSRTDDTRVPPLTVPVAQRQCRGELVQLAFSAHDGSSTAQRRLVTLEAQGAMAVVVVSMSSNGHASSSSSLIPHLLRECHDFVSDLTELLCLC
jgi:hypothetical protein